MILICCSSGAAAALAVHEAWDIAARVPKHTHSRSNATHASVPASDGIVFENISSFPVAQGSQENLKGTDRSRELGEGMERLRLCVSLLKKQVQVRDHRTIAIITFVIQPHF